MWDKDDKKIPGSTPKKEPGYLNRVRKNTVWKQEHVLRRGQKENCVIIHYSKMCSTSFCGSECPWCFKQSSFQECGLSIGSVTWASLFNAYQTWQKYVLTFQAHSSLPIVWNSEAIKIRFFQFVWQQNLTSPEYNWWQAACKVHLFNLYRIILYLFVEILACLNCHKFWLKYDVCLF